MDITTAELSLQNYRCMECSSGPQVWRLSQLGREERDGGIFEENLKHIVKVHNVICKKGMEMAASVATKCKNEMIRKGGIAPTNGFLDGFREASATFSGKKNGANLASCKV